MRMTQGAVDYRSTDRPEGRAPAAAAAGRAAADAGARPGPARLVRPAAAPAGRAAVRRAAGPPAPDGARRARLRRRARPPNPYAQQAPQAAGRRRCRTPRPGRRPPPHPRPAAARPSPRTPDEQPPAPDAAGRPQPQLAGAPARPYPAYTSPIPVVRTHLGHALASEWTKIRSVRSTMWTLGVFVLLVVGIGLRHRAGRRASRTAPPTRTRCSASASSALLLGQICVITLGVLTIASEYGTGMIRTTMTACPSRGRVLIAKSIVFFLRRLRGHRW